MLKKVIATLLALSAAAAFAAVDVNKATVAELETVKGIGPVAAASIVDERKKTAFKDWADVMQRVRGIKQAKAGKLSEAGLTVNGQPFQGVGARKAAEPGAKPGRSAKDDGGAAALAKK